MQDLLGKGWSTWSSIAFVLYILTYAYISAGSSIIVQNFANVVSLPQAVAGLVFCPCCCFLRLIYQPERAVDRLSTILIGGMIMIGFVFAIGGLFTEVKMPVLFNTTESHASYLPYALAALPYLLTSFGYHGNIPGLVTYYVKTVKP